MEAPTPVLAPFQTKKREEMQWSRQRGNGLRKMLKRENRPCQKEPIKTYSNSLMS